MASFSFVEACSFIRTSPSLLTIQSQNVLPKREDSLIANPFTVRATRGQSCWKTVLDSWSCKSGRMHLLAFNGLAFAKMREDLPASDWEQNIKVDESNEDNNPHMVTHVEGEGFQRLKDVWRNRATQNEDFKSRLKRFGLAGVMSYGLFNTCYYLMTFLFVWLYVTPSPGGLGFVPAAKRLLKVLAMVWAGSQVTKLARLGGALTLAPLVDKGLNWFTKRFNFKSRGKAFGVIVASCFGVALLVFVTMTILWA